MVSQLVLVCGYVHLSHANKQTPRVTVLSLHGAFFRVSGVGRRDALRVRVVRQLLGELEKVLGQRPGFGSH